jgi:glutathione S-transferase
MQTDLHQLLGAEVSYYTAKVRAYLRYKAIPFEEVPATREVYRDIIVPRTGVRFIPVLITDDDLAVQDSADIIELLERRYPNAPITPPSPLQKLVALLFQLYGDEWLLLPAMHYRWNWPENRAFAIEEFGRLSVPSATAEEQRALGEKLSGPFAGALPFLGVHPATVDAIETSYAEFLAELDRHLAQEKFLLGTRPCIGDLSLFGPLYAHLYRDPASGRLMRELAPRVVEWVERLQSPVPLAGDFLPDGSVPPTLEPLLTRLFSEFGPVLSSTIEKLTTSTFEPNSPLPRSIGTHEFRLADATATRAIFPFNVWRWQPAHDQYQALLHSDARESARALLERVGGRALIEMPLPRRMNRRDNRLWFDS